MQVYSTRETIEQRRRQLSSDGNDQATFVRLILGESYLGGRAFLHFFRDLHRRPREKTQCCLSVWIFFVNFSLSHPSLFNFLDLRGHTVASCALCVCFGGKSLASVGWMRGVGRECPPPKQSSGTALRGQDLANLSPSPPPPIQRCQTVCVSICLSLARPTFKII